MTDDTPRTGLGRRLTGAIPPLPEPEDRFGEVGARVRAARVRTGVLSAGVVAAVVALALAVPGLLLGAAEQAEPAVDQDLGRTYRGTVIVLESPDHGPRLCPASYAVALPGGVDEPPYPQCTGPANEIAGWDWEVVESESAEGRTWGTYLVEGAWDGEVFTLTTPAEPREPEATWPGNRDQDGGVSPCPEPPGGWVPVDRSKATYQALDELQGWLGTIPEYAGSWLDHSHLDEISNDPTRFVLNVMFVGDPAEWEPRVREIWGGALCVSRAEYSLAQLNAAQSDIHARYPHPAVLASGQNMHSNAVRVEVLVATPGLQAEFDQRYGPGAINLEGWLEPVDQ